MSDINEVYSLPYCTECKQPCKPIIVDFGNGAYEFWGQRGVDRQLSQVSDCCEADLMDGPPEPLEQDPSDCYYGPPKAP